MAPLSADIWLAVALYGGFSERVALIQVANSVNFFLYPLLYRNIAVGRSARKLVRTLATNQRLPPMVCTIVVPFNCSTHILAGRKPVLRRSGRSRRPRTVGIHPPCHGQPLVPNDRALDPSTATNHPPPQLPFKMFRFHLLRRWRVVRFCRFPGSAAGDGP